MPRPPSATANWIRRRGFDLGIQRRLGLSDDDVLGAIARESSISFDEIRALDDEELWRYPGPRIEVADR